MITTKPADDSAIPDDATLLRRIYPGWYVGSGEETRLSKQAFEDPKDGSSMSVWIRERLVEFGLSAEDVLAGYQEYGLVSLTAKQVRDAGFGVTWAPDPADGTRGMAHAEVHCSKSPSKRKHLVQSCIHVAGRLATE